MFISTFDTWFRGWLRTIRIPLARSGIFIIFFWFGVLKVFGLSPATDLVRHLFEQTMPGFVNFNYFIIGFGSFEMLIGILFLVKGFERVVLPLLLFHMATTALPLILLPHEAWIGYLVPTLEGQYIIKNIVIIATSFFIASSLRPIKVVNIFPRK